MRPAPRFRLRLPRIGGQVAAEEQRERGELHERDPRSSDHRQERQPRPVGHLCEPLDGERLRLLEPLIPRASSARACIDAGSCCLLPGTPSVSGREANGIDKMVPLRFRAQSAPKHPETD